RAAARDRSPAMSFRLIEAEKAEHTISRPCSVLGVTTRAGYYAWRRRRPSRRALGDAELERLITHVFSDSLETCEAPRVHAELREPQGVCVRKERVTRMMRRLGIGGVSRRGKRRQATIPNLAHRPRLTSSVAGSW